MLLRCRTELLLLRLSRGWPELLLRSRPELLLLLRSRLESLWLRCWPLPLRRLRSRLESLGLRCSLLGCTRGRGIGLELTKGLSLFRAELLLLNGKVLLVNLEMAHMCVLLVSGGPE